MSNIKFLDRETTDAIRLKYEPDYAKLTVKEMSVNALKKGKLNLGYHYVLRDSGEIEKGIKDSYYADYMLDGYKTSIYVLVTADKLSDAAKRTLDKLISELNLPLKGD